MVLDLTTDFIKPGRRTRRKKEVSGVRISSVQSRRAPNKSLSFTVFPDAMREFGFRVKDKAVLHISDDGVFLSCAPADSVPEGLPCYTMSVYGDDPGHKAACLRITAANDARAIQLLERIENGGAVVTPLQDLTAVQAKSPLGKLATTIRVL